MLEFIAANLAPIMFATLVVFLLAGYPVAFTLAAVGLMFFVLGVELAPYSGGAINLSWPLLKTLPERIYGVMTNETLLAIPFFAFMGLILERSGMAEDLLETIGQLFGTVRGGLAYAVIFVGALLAATTGVVAASVISMGLISLPIMLRYGYDPRLRDRHHRRFGHAGADHSALAGADRAGRPARPLGRRHVHRRAGAGPDARRLLCRLRFLRRDVLAGRGARPATRGASIHREPDGIRGYTSLVAAGARLRRPSPAFADAAARPTRTAISSSSRSASRSRSPFVVAVVNCVAQPHVGDRGSCRRSPSRSCS